MEPPRIFGTKRESQKNIGSEKYIELKSLTVQVSSLYPNDIMKKLIYFLGFKNMLYSIYTLISEKRGTVKLFIRNFPCIWKHYMIPGNKEQMVLHYPS